eukprot:53794-Chlamydomonas_euryale.AAC.1
MHTSPRPPHTHSHPGIPRAPQIVALLLERGADVNAVSAFGDTPLHEAARAGHTTTMGLLLASGAAVGA